MGRIRGGDRGEASDAARDTGKVPSGGCWETLRRWEEKTGPHREYLPEGDRENRLWTNNGIPTVCSVHISFSSPELRW